MVAGDRLIGILSDRDLSVDDRSLRRLEAHEHVGEPGGEGKPVEAVMSADVETIGPDASVGDAARLLLERHISALPVVDADRTLLGIISLTDCASPADDPRPRPRNGGPSARRRRAGWHCAKGTGGGSVGTRVARR